MIMGILYIILDLEHQEAYIWNYFVYTKYFGVTGSSIFKFGGFFNLGSAYGFKSREEAENFIKSCEISDKVAE